ncbi:thiamine-phosphate kinase [Paenibacillus woosongensis]|uniref:Thiamine-monophosphate kinase n=1 Tax=Paenibacillus woosongensis TaxID=307580 RepID=A0AA95L327_9BACL|nr:thiamine-phosphate kinase [Paenibacillus woosongensis]WHX50772.1 thiamine-phosphate kinase [Paenibacillus woosongensis]
MSLTLKDIGEKKLISSTIKPLFNPGNNPDLSGDDCAVIRVPKSNHSISLSTDRVPADLISFKLGIIDYYGLGYYLAVLNISDVYASGSKPVGLLLNLAFPDDFKVKDFDQILLGIKNACDEYRCNVIGGDLSHSIEMSLSATSVGVSESSRTIYRSGAKVGHLVYCSDYLGLTSTAFHYYLQAKPKGLRLSEEEESVLANQFRNPRARATFSEALSKHGECVTAMDNTDGAAQSYLEIAEINNLGITLDVDQLKIHEISYKVANYINKDIVEVALGSGADFQLLGTIDPQTYEEHKDQLDSTGMVIVGRCIAGEGIHLKRDGQVNPFEIKGWDYFSNGVLGESLS